MRPYPTPPGPHPLIAQMRELRKDLWLSQKEVVDVAGLNCHSLSRWELGLASPRLRSLDLLGERFGYRLVWAKITDPDPRGATLEPMSPDLDSP